MRGVIRNQVFAEQVAFVDRGPELRSLGLEGKANGITDA